MVQPRYAYSSHSMGVSEVAGRSLAIVAKVRGGPTGAVQLKQLATDYSQQKHTTWAGRGRIIIAQSG